MMPDLRARSYQPEIIDTEVLSLQEWESYLSHLENINHFTFLYTPVLRWLEKQGVENSGRQWKILEVASGRGDMARQIWEFSKKKGFNVSITAIDINPHVTNAAQRQAPKGASLYFETADVFSYAPKAKSDYIICVQFAHHLNNEDLISFIQWLDNTACYGWLIYDLHRHRIPYYFIKFILQLLPVHPYTKNDGPLSVAKAFTRKDWHRFLRSAGIDRSRVCIKWHFPFRYSIACNTNISEE